MYHDGRHVIPINNSRGKCMLENWVEERAVSHIDPQALKDGQTSRAQLLKDGHKGIVTTKFDSGLYDLTTHLDHYRTPAYPGVRTRGVKAELMEKMLLEQALKETEDILDPPPSPVDFRSVTHKDFNKEDFVPRKPAPTAAHDYRTEQPVSFWTEHRDKIHSVTQVKPTFDSPFKRNSAFSKPIDEYWEADENKPYEPSHVPNM